MNVAILLPCYNEAKTIEKVVKDFRRELPEAVVYVYDNNSTDGSGELAESAGAIVRKVTQQGKGFVVRRMFREVDADIYVMVDSDDTYPADEVHKLIDPIRLGTADMVNGDRLSSTYMIENKRPGHNFGNLLVRFLIRILWNRKVNDVMTGYRAFSRFFVKSCPVLSNGFQIETEMTLHTIDKRLSLIEIPIQYRDRPIDSPSKLNTVSDGMKVLATIFTFFRFYRPLCFYFSIAGFLVLIALCLFTPVFVDYLHTGLVPRFPTLIVSGFLMIVAVILSVSGLILSASKKQFDQLFEIVNSRC